MMKPPRIVDIAAANAAATVISATVPCRRWIIRESMSKADGTSNPNFSQGLQFQIADNKADNNGTVYGPVQQRPAASTTNDPGQFPEVAYPDPEDASFHGPHGDIVANGPGVQIGKGVTAAQPLCKIQSLTNTATSVEVIEIY